MSCSRGCCPDFKTHVKNVSIGSFPSETTLRERKLTLDRDAYKELRRQGLQPPHVSGSYVNARSATNPTEVELGRPLPVGVSESQFKEMT